MLARRESSSGHVRFEIGGAGLTAIIETERGDIVIPAKNIKYIPSALVEHLLPDNKNKYSASVISEKNRAFVDFLRSQAFEFTIFIRAGKYDKFSASMRSKVVKNITEVETVLRAWEAEKISDISEPEYILEFAYSKSTYYGQIALSLAIMGGSFFSGPATPVVFSIGASTLCYSAFQPCQDLSWGSFALEGAVGAVASVATMGLGEVAKGARAAIKAVDSPVGRQALHFTLNGATSIAGQVSGAGVKAALKGDKVEITKVLTAKSIVSTVAAAGAGGFAGAVAGKASVPAATVLSVDALSSKGTLYGSLAGGAAGTASSASVTAIWNSATGKDITEDLVDFTFRGAIVGASTGASAGSRMALKAYKEAAIEPGSRPVRDGEKSADEVTADVEDHTDELEEEGIVDKHGPARAKAARKWVELTDLKLVQLADGKSPLMYGIKIPKEGRDPVTVWFSIRPVWADGRDMIDLVHSKLDLDETVRILAGTHGSPTGFTCQDDPSCSAFFSYRYLRDTVFGSSKNVTVTNVCSKNASEIFDIIKSAEEKVIICYWCWSDASLAVVKALLELAQKNTESAPAPAS
jgi:hypothetical protein